MIDVKKDAWKSSMSTPPQGATNHQGREHKRVDTNAAHAASQSWLQGEPPIADGQK